MQPRSIDEEIRSAAMIVGLMWFAVLLDWAVFFVEFPLFGIVPRTGWGVPGIVAAPFIHIGLLHVFGVTVPLAILLVWVANRGLSVWEVTLETAILAGLLTWSFGRENVVYVGGSGLVFGLATLVAIEGLLGRKPTGAALGFAVVGIYGGLTWLGVYPDGDPPVVWDGQAWGALAGAIVGVFQWARRRKASADIAVGGS